jgi:hypothetical protein
MMVATIQPAQAAGVMAPGGTFVALGDSYAAGNLIPASPAGTPAGCPRSTHNYPFHPNRRGSRPSPGRY